MGFSTLVLLVKNEGHQSEHGLIMLESMVTLICSECCKMIMNVSKLTISTIIT